MSAVPWTYDRRPDTGTTNVRLGIWLFLASEAMLMASLLSAYVLLRTGAAAWADVSAWWAWAPVGGMTLLLGAAALAGRRAPWWSAAAGSAFLLWQAIDYGRLLDLGLAPATDLAVACWFVLTGVHWVHAAGAVAASLWLGGTRTRLADAHWRERAHAVALYWWFVSLTWLVLVTAFLF